jgi:hypothetical protein
MILHCSGSVHVTAARETMKSWLIAGKFPFETLEAIIGMKKSNEVKCYRTSECSYNS